MRFGRERDASRFDPSLERQFPDIIDASCSSHPRGRRSSRARSIGRPDRKIIQAMLWGNPLGRPPPRRYRATFLAAHDAGPCIPSCLRVFKRGIFSTDIHEPKRASMIPVDGSAESPLDGLSEFANLGQPRSGIEMTESEARPTQHSTASCKAQPMLGAFDRFSSQHVSDALYVHALAQPPELARPGILCHQLRRPRLGALRG